MCWDLAVNLVNKGVSRENNVWKREDAFTPGISQLFSVLLSSSPAGASVTCCCVLSVLNYLLSQTTGEQIGTNCRGDFPGTKI